MNLLKNLTQGINIILSGGQLASQLSNVCNLIASGLYIPVFKTAIGSFDTHNNQQNTHRRLLKDLDISISSTVSALKDLGVWENSIIMTYSEFGRRANEMALEVQIMVWLHHIL